MSDWKQDGNLVYRLNDCNTNHDEICVTMADGERGISERTARAIQIRLMMENYEHLERQRNALLRSLKEIYEWTDHKHTPWAKNAKALIESVESNSPIPMAASVPEGYKLVPIKLTPEIKAVMRKCEKLNSLTFEGAWAEMLAAAPQIRVNSTQEKTK